MSLGVTCCRVWDISKGFLLHTLIVHQFSNDCNLSLIHSYVQRNVTFKINVSDTMSHTAAQI